MRGLVPELPRPAWVVLGGDTLSALGSGLTLPFFVVYLERVRGIDLQVAGLALSTLALASIPGNLLAGTLADRIGSRRTLMLGLVTSAAGTTWFAFVTATWEAFGAAALIGLGNSMIWPSQDALLATTVPVEQRSSVFSVRHAALNLGLSVGAVGAGVIADFSSARSFEVLYLVDALTFLAFIPVLLTLKGYGERSSVEADVAGSYAEVLRDRTFRRLWVFGALIVMLGYVQYQAAFAPYATTTGGIGSHALAIAFAANTVAVVAVQLVVLRVMTGHRRTTSLALVYATWGISWGATVAAAQLGGGAAGVLGFAVAMALFAVGETLVSPALTPLVNDLAPDRLRGRYNALYTLSLTTGFIAGPAIAGVGLGVGDGTPFFLVLVAACFVAALGALRLRRHVPTTADVIGAHEAAPA